MPPSAIDRLIDCQAALISALDAGDVSAVEDATARVARALEALRPMKTAPASTTLCVRQKPRAVGSIS